MNINATSEFARSQMLKRQASDTRTALDTTSKELTTGLKSSSYEATNGNLSRLFSLERMVARNAVHQDTISLTELRVDVAQDGIGRIASRLDGVSTNLLTAARVGDFTAASVHGRHALAAFEDAVTVLNTQVTGQSVFAGEATQGPALADADAILAELGARIAGTTDAGTAIAAIEEYFSAPAGEFFASGYIGATVDLAAAEIGEGQRVEHSVRADAGELVAVLRGYAMAAVVANGSFGGDRAEQMAMLEEAGEQSVAARDGLGLLRETLGIAQFELNAAKAQRTAEREGFELARANIMTADPYEVAARFEALKNQLDTVYTVTARLSTLRFTNYLR